MVASYPFRVSKIPEELAAATVRISGAPKAGHLAERFLLGRGNQPNAAAFTVRGSDRSRDGNARVRFAITG